MNSKAKIFCRAVAGLALALFLHGCSTTYEMQVDAIKNPVPVAPDADSYVIVPRDPSVDTNDLRYKETVNWIKTALSAKGMYEALDPLEADMVIEVDYGMEAPRQEVTVVEEPVYRTRREPGTYVTRSVRDPETGKVQTIRIYVPGRAVSELIGYQERAITRIVNEKYLVLTAKENTLGEGGDKAAQELWSVTVTNEDESNDLREYLPIMASAATDYIGEDTQDGKTVRLKSDDEVVAFVKKGLAKERLENTPPPASL
ncbi:hypothetical protein [Pelagicoccus sp. SDUM812003]|uniref:hypothetical protein n=1 Tax=Pelagicoccus sp. SDUM812003 TaxID=3041267 RepID=UPI00281077AB|nr:hypothetical protein [Pelagicoccus sp. SDUM812003]MDQ8203269.1 hypothetical protein [Pelagicoccus sp. SDUM812003]